MSVLDVVENTGRPNARRGREKKGEIRAQEPTLSEPPVGVEQCRMQTLAD